MAAHQLLGLGLDHVLKGKAPGLLGNAAVKEDVQKDIAQFAR